MNDVNSEVNYKLSFYFDIPYHLCKNNEEDLVDLQCTPSIEYEIALKDKWISILYNQKRYVSDNYDGKGHIEKETAV